MADISKRGPDCDDSEGERGERGARGKRGRRGHSGHDGRDGDMGVTGPSGLTGPTGPASSGSGPQYAMALQARWKDTPSPGTTSIINIQGSSFVDLGMIRPGSLVGIHARLSQNLSTGSLTVTATINGVVTPLTLNMPLGANAASDIHIPGEIPYVPLDLIGVQFTTSADYAPAGDLEVWLEAVEQIP